MVSTAIVLAVAGEVAEFTYKAVAGGDWYEAVVVLYKASQANSKNLDTDQIEAYRAIRGDQISASNCPTAFQHTVCDGSTPHYVCDSDGYITDSLTVPSGGHHYLAFYAASYDRSGGTALGAKMMVKSFALLPSTCKAACNLGAVKPPQVCTAVTCTGTGKNQDGDASNGCEHGAAPTPAPEPARSPAYVCTEAPAINKEVLAAAAAAVKAAVVTTVVTSASASAAGGGAGGGGGGALPAMVGAVQFMPLLAQIDSETIDPAYREFAASMSMFNMQFELPAFMKVALLLPGLPSRSVLPCVCDHGLVLALPFNLLVRALALTCSMKRRKSLGSKMVC